MKKGKCKICNESINWIDWAEITGSGDVIGTCGCGPIHTLGEGGKLNRCPCMCCDKRE